MVGPEAPLTPGLYKVEVTVSDPRYTGHQEAILVVTPPQPAGAIEKPEVQLEFGNLVRTYDGAMKPVLVRSEPRVDVRVTYDGQMLAPFDAGEYEVRAVVTDPNYTGSITGRLIIRKAEAVVGFWESSLNPAVNNFDVAKVYTIPSGLEVDVFYDGSQSAPRLVGASSLVVASVNNANWKVSAEAVFTVKRAVQEISVTEMQNVTMSGRTKQLELFGSVSSGKAIEYRVLSGRASVTGSVLTVYHPGPIKVLASVDGDEFWAPRTKEFDVKVRGVSTGDRPPVLRIERLEGGVEVVLHGTPNEEVSLYWSTTPVREEYELIGRLQLDRNGAAHFAQPISSSERLFFKAETVSSRR